MVTIRKIWDFIRDLLGFRRNSKYIRTYLNEANIKSSIYMAAIVIVLEIWMIIRNLNKYVITYWNNFSARGCSSNFDLLYTYIGLYILFIMCSIAVLIFATTYFKKTESKALFITNIVISSICILYPFFLFFEHLNGVSVNSITTLMVYVSMPLLGGFILSNILYSKKSNKNNIHLSIGVIICFALVCLSFGIKVGYSDFANAYFNSKGDPNFDRLKMITCFLTMIIFVACLLIWKPYISIIMLTGVFIGFMYMLKGYEGREFLEADEINYITFLISLTMITISIYQQRVTEAKKDERLIYDANYDSLAEIHNVKYLTDSFLLNNTINPALNKNKIFLFINIANFRAINDQKGFEFGDLFLINLSKEIVKTFGIESSARQGDDHFVIYTDSFDYLEKIEEVKSFVEKETSGLFVNLKVGGYLPKDNESPYKSIDKARYACGTIKRKPDSYFVLYDDKMDSNINKRQYIVNNLDKAINNGWIRPFYQPVVWSNSRELCGVEALARWIDPVYGFLSPADFIPVLEDNRLIHKLDKCIIETVCKNMRDALDKGRKIVPVSINFSRLDFELMDVVSHLDSILKEYDIDKRYIHVEITESALSEDVNLLNETIGRLKEKDYSIWLDDFGSGYSSLNVLKDFKFDVIKIDMTFLSNFDTNEKTKDILDCIVQLAERLEMKTLTEGVETINEAEFLEKIGCGRLQGYLFGKPFSLSDFEAKIDNEELIISKNLL